MHPVFETINPSTILMTFTGPCLSKPRNSNIVYRCLVSGSSLGASASAGSSRGSEDRAWRHSDVLQAPLPGNTLCPDLWRPQARGTFLAVLYFKLLFELTSQCHFLPLGLHTASLTLSDDVLLVF